MPLNQNLTHLKTCQDDYFKMAVIDINIDEAPVHLTPEIASVLSFF